MNRAAFGWRMERAFSLNSLNLGNYTSRVNRQPAMKRGIDDSMDFNSALEHALDGDSVLFLGAGFSLGATNSRGEPFELGSQFASRLAGAISLPSNTELPDAADAFLDNRGAAALAKEVLQSFRATRLAKHHLSISSVPWRRVYTTNYDNVFELASGESKSPFRPVTLSEKPSDFDQKELLCIHFNGYVERVTSSLGDELKLTDTSYITASVEASPWASVFRLDLTMAKSVFFVGYSLVDLDVARLLAATEQLQEKTFFVVGSNPTSRTENRAVRYGTVQRFDSVWFGKQLENKRSKYTPAERTQPNWFCIEPYTSKLGDTTQVSDRSIFDLLLRGNIDRQLGWNALHGGTQPYLVERSAIANIMKLLNDPVNVAVVTGNLGNGKSVVAEIIAGLATAAGRPSYFLAKRSPTMAEELSYLCSSTKPYVLVVDTYPAWMDALEILGRHRNENMSLLLTSRTGPNDVLVDRIQEIFARHTIREINIEQMDDAELEKVNSLLEQYGLWGDRAAQSRRSRLGVLRSRCRGEWQSILVDLFQAPQIQARFDEILKTLDSKGGFYDVLLGILALTVLGQRVTMDMLADIFGNRVLDAAFQHSERVAEFIDFRRGEVTNRSSVAAQFVLNRVANPNSIVDAMTTMARSLDRLGASYRLYNETLRSLLQFSQIETILPNRAIDERREAAFRYYERVKNLKYCQTNPQFWLQYAIAALVFGDFERSEKYFQSAYAFAERSRNYDTHKIDNHYARLLLQQASGSSSPAVGMKLFRDARKIIFEQIQTERLHYPYRVATAIGSFYDTFAGALKDAEKEEVINAARYIEKRIAGLPATLQNQKYVVECRNAMARLRLLSGAQVDK